MSTQTIRAFLDKVHQDPALQEKLSRIPQSLDAASAQQLSDLAREAGFDISVSDFIAAVNINEINDEELQEVSGGDYRWKFAHKTKPKSEKPEEEVSWWNKIFG